MNNEGELNLLFLKLLFDLTFDEIFQVVSAIKFLVCWKPWRTKQTIVFVYFAPRKINIFVLFQNACVL